MVKKQSTVLPLSVLFCFLLVYSPPPSNAQSNSNFVTGQVLDDAANQPINNATVSVWKIVIYSRDRASWSLTRTTKTNVNGQFMVEVEGGLQCQLYAYFDDPNSPGFDYTPVSISFQMPKENVSFSIRLFPAASVVFDGDLWFVESTLPLTSFSYTIEDNGTDLSAKLGYVRTYGTSFSSYGFLSLPPNHVVVPVDRKIIIHASASLDVSRYGGEQVSKSFVISDMEQLDLAKGVLARVNVEKYSTWVNYDFMIGKLNSSNQLLKEVEQKGFHVVVEKQDLAKAENLVGHAKTELDVGQFKQAYIDLREAYIKTVGVNKSLESVYADALASTSLLTLFLSLTALSLSYVLFERLTLKLSIYPIFFLLFFSVFYLAFPSCSLVSTETLRNGIFMSLGVSLLTSFVFPRFLKDRFVSTFSLAKRNLRRRKTRFLLTLVTVTVLVISFVSLTSFSTGYGLTSGAHSYPVNSIPEGLLVQQPLPDPFVSPYNFIPMDSSSLELFERNSEILLIAPRAESQPKLGTLGALIQPSTQSRIPVYGILGIKPSAESKITHIDEAVVEGRYLRDDDENSVLLCKRIARGISVGVNDKLILNILGLRQKVGVVGLFDQDLFSSCKDINGEGIAPKRLFKLVEEDESSPILLTSCEPDEIIVTTLEFSLKLPDVYLSGVVALIKDPEKGPSLAREIALNQGYSVWYSSGKEVFHAVLGSFIESIGLSVLIPWVIVILNVVITMLNSIYEHRREIAILSSVGLNPLDILGLFVAEATVIGVVGGGVGYLLGISNYKLMPSLSLIIEVRPKVSAVWSLASVLVSVSAVLVGAFVALRSSVVMTPSTLRRWSVEKKTRSVGMPWVFTLPFKLREEELNFLFNYVVTHFRSYIGKEGFDEDIGEIKYLEDETPEASIRRVCFDYCLGQRSSMAAFPFQLVARRRKGEETYSFEVVCNGSEKSVKETVSFVRVSIIEWSADQVRA